MKRALVTGSSGLVGSAAVADFDRRGWTVHGVDNNLRRDFFGPDGDTTSNLERLRRETRRFEHHDLDVRDRAGIGALVSRLRPDVVIHCAAQPSHDLAGQRVFDDFDINAVGTLNLLEAARVACPETPFIFMSTNKVYGDAPNERRLEEQETRFDYADPAERHGIDERCRTDRSLHSLFGASKLAADTLVQEYGRYFGMPTVCFRAGCLTGGAHAGVELHGFLAYLARAIREGRTYRVYGHGGKQVRDNLHADDVCLAFEAFRAAPRVAAVYNLGGGRDNSVSVIEAITRFEAITGRSLEVTFLDEPRRGDHICYLSDLRRFRADYPHWRVTRSLDDIFDELGGRSTS